MRRLAAGAALLILLLVLFRGRPFAGQRAEALPLAEASGLPTDQIMVRFQDTEAMISMSAGEEEALLGRMSAAAGEPLTLVRPMSGGLFVFALPQPQPPAEVASAARRLARMPGILFADADRVWQIVPESSPVPAAPAALNGAARQPDDPYFANQWHYVYAPGTAEGVNLPGAWDVTTGRSSGVVAVLDTGILDHEDLSGRVLPGYDFISNTDMSNDGDGRDSDPADPGDWTEDGDCGTPRPSSWHGSHVAGTIGAASNNGVGVSGVNWKAKILPVRVLGRCGGMTSDIIDAVRWSAGLPVPGAPANGNPADVINLSLGGGGPCQTSEQQAFDAVIAAGTTVVIAAGNGNRSAADHSPGNCDRVITVAATDREGDRAYYSNFGSLIELSAPGGETGANGVLSIYNKGETVPAEDGYAYYQGTSMAAPHVAGVAALIMGENPGWSPVKVLTRLQQTARAFPGGSGCTTSTCGAGIVDAAAALVEESPAATATATATPTATATETMTATATATPTATATATATATDTATTTATATATDTPTDTATAAPTAASTPAVTPMNTAVFTPAASVTPTATATRDWTATDFVFVPVVGAGSEP